MKIKLITIKNNSVVVDDERAATTAAAAAVAIRERYAERESCLRASGRCRNAVCRAPGGALYRRAARGNSGQRDVPTHAAAAADTDDDAAGQLPGHRHFSTVLYYYAAGAPRVCVCARACIL